MFNSLLVSIGLAKGWPTITKEDVASHSVVGEAASADTRTSDGLKLKANESGPSGAGKRVLVVAGDSVFDVTAYIEDHPGGRAALIRRSGGKTDCTTDLKFHSQAARKQWKDHKIAEIGKVTTYQFASSTNKSSAANGGVGSSSNELNVEDAHLNVGSCKCNCHEGKTIATQTMCCRAGTGKPCCREDPTADTKGCVWRSSGTGSFARPGGPSASVSQNNSFSSTPTTADVARKSPQPEVRETEAEKVAV